MNVPSPYGRGLGRGKIKMKLDPQLLEFAKTMRSNFEHLMWKILRAKRFTSIKFVYKINIFHLKIVIYLEY